MSNRVFPNPHPLLHYRVGLGLSLRQLARRARLDFRRLSTIERGLSVTEIRRLARVLRCSPNDLQARTEDRHAAA
jgi:transcriptional regulator with XRE-family HTH domain